jgi:hypothetical protein
MIASIKKYGCYYLLILVSDIIYGKQFILISVNPNAGGAPDKAGST